MSQSPSSSASDAELVLAVRRDRSDAAFSVLYDRHTPRAFQTAWRILGGNEHEAEDACRTRGSAPIATLDTWRNDRGVRRVAARDHGPCRHRSCCGGSDGSRSKRTSSSAAPEQSGEQIDLETAIAALAPGYRAVLVLHDVEGFTHEEIAERLGITAGTSKGQLFKARRAVRARLATDTAEKIVMATHDEFTEDDWTPEESALLAALPNERVPSNELKARTIEAVRRHVARTASHRIALDHGAR